MSNQEERALFVCPYCAHWCWLLPAEQVEPLAKHSRGGIDCMGSGLSPMPVSLLFGVALRQALSCAGAH